MNCSRITEERGKFLLLTIVDYRLERMVSNYDQTPFNGLPPDINALPYAQKTSVLATGQILAVVVCNHSLGKDETLDSVSVQR